jgi:hypothetical protein
MTSDQSWDVRIVGAICDGCAAEVLPSDVSYRSPIQAMKDFMPQRDWPLMARSSALHGQTFEHVTRTSWVPGRCGRVLLSVEALE